MLRRSMYTTPPAPPPPPMSLAPLPPPPINSRSAVTAVGKVMEPFARKLYANDVPRFTALPALDALGREGRYEPAGEIDVHAVAPAPENDPAAQAVHAVDPAL